MSSLYRAVALAVVALSFAQASSAQSTRIAPYAALLRVSTQDDIAQQHRRCEARREAARLEEHRREDHRYDERMHDEHVSDERLREAHLREEWLRNNGMLAR